MDQQFDFEDQDYQKPKQPTNNNKKKNYEDDFFDLDEPKQNRRENQAIFQNIRNSGTNKVNQSSRNSKNINNPFAENMKNRNKPDEFQFQEQVLNNPSNISDKRYSKNHIKRQEQEVRYEEEVQDIPIKKSTLKKQPSEKQEEENYAQQDFQDDNYGNDFEQPQQIPKKEHEKSKTDANLKKAPYKLPPKKVSRQANSRQKPGTGTRSNTSRQKMNNRSMSKQQSRNIQTAYVSNKYTNLVQKTFPEANVNNEQPDKIMKMNDKMRLMIKKLNQQLNGFIDRNMLQLKKNNKNDKNVTLQDRCRVLEEQKKNNDQLIARLQYDLKKLQGKQQTFGQQDELSKEQNIRDLKKKIKDSEKEIIQLKFQVNNEGKKLTRHEDEKKNAQNILNVKNNLLQYKRDQEKGSTTIQKLDEKFQELTSKMNQIENMFKQKVQEAHNKGLNLENKKQLVKKYEQSKKKLENIRNHRSKVGNLLSTKADFIVHQNEQIKSSINNLINLIQTKQNDIANSQRQSYKIIQKAKENPKINQTILAGLEEILKALESYENTQKTPVNEDTKKQIKSNQKNYDSVNQQKNGPMRNLSRNKVLRKQQIEQPNHIKPTLIKKKKVQEQRDGKQRVWKDQEQATKHNTIQQPIKKDAHENNKTDVLLFQQKQKQQEKKKPFTLKKNRKTQDKPEQTKEQIIVEQKKKQQEKKPQDTPSMVAPKMMKFKRNKNSEEIPQENSRSQAKLISQQRPKEEQQSQIPSIAPKRFNLRNRAQKKQEAYFPTTEIKNQNRISQEMQIKNQQKPVMKQQQYKPFKKENTYEPPGLKLEPQDKKQDTITSKPTFNLRLRDRKKNQQTGQSSYNPLQKINQEKIQLPQKQQKQENNDAPKFSIGKMRAARNRDNQNVAITLDQKKQQPKQQITNPYNPYANATNAPKRQRQGRIKKPKLQSSIDKPKLNIYEQAQDMTGANEFVGSKKTVDPVINVNSNKQDDITTMLGIKKQKPMQGYEDLLGGNNNQHVGRRQRNKKQDFFGEIDL